MKYLPNVKLAIISPNPERLGKTFQEEIFVKPTLKILKGYTFSNIIKLVGWEEPQNSSLNKSVNRTNFAQRTLVGNIR